MIQLTPFLSHTRQWQQLNSLLQQNQLHPAWLLTGMKGIGKNSFAKTFSHHLLLADQGGNRGFIESMLAQNIHPNLLMVEKGVDEDGEPNNDISVQHIRKITTFLQQSPGIPGWRIILIDAVDDMNRNASNALLKVLEEPPAKTIFLLVCHALGRILPTIRSRCCLLPFQALSPEDLAAHTPHGSPLAAAFARGSIGRLQSLQSFDVGTLFAECINLVQASLKNNYVTITAYVSGLDKKDPKNLLMLEVLEWLLYRLICLNQGEQPTLKEDEQILSLAGQRSQGHWVKAYEVFSSYLQATIGGHLDSGHLLLGGLLIIENPQLAKEFTHV